MNNMLSWCGVTYIVWGSWISSQFVGNAWKEVLSFNVVLLESREETEAGNLREGSKYTLELVLGTGV